VAKENSVKRLGSFDGSTVDSVHHDSVSQGRGERHPNPAGGVSAPERKEVAILQAKQNVGFDFPDTRNPKL